MRTCGFCYVHTASDGIEALNYLDYTRCDLIVSDWNMEPMDGLELLREVRRTPSTAKTPLFS
jgi:two-component system, chemotaxis family, chemotaxis protein CheY